MYSYPLLNLNWNMLSCAIRIRFHTNLRFESILLGSRPQPTIVVLLPAFFLRNYCSLLAYQLLYAPGPSWAVEPGPVYASIPSTAHRFGPATEPAQLHICLAFPLKKTVLAWHGVTVTTSLASRNGDRRLIIQSHCSMLVETMENVGFRTTVTVMIYDECYDFWLIFSSAHELARRAFRWPCPCDHVTPTMAISEHARTIRACSCSSNGWDQIRGEATLKVVGAQAPIKIWKITIRNKFSPWL